MAESTQQVESVRSETANPQLQPLDPRNLRHHVHHGRTAAMWTGTLVFLVAFVIGGVAILIGPNWPLFIGACVLAALGIAAGLVMQALGLGAFEKN
jgi:cytosine/uracil/thiamine/allantoin permease